MLTKAVIPAAGFGTRMLPAAKAVPKEMLPVLGRPTIEYVAGEAVEAGVDDLILIVSGDKKAVEDHFDAHAELERRLAEKGRGDWLASVNAIIERAQVHSVRQREQLGLGHAVLQAERHVGDSPFLCMLGDTIFSGGNPSRQLAEAQQRLGGSVIGLERVPREKVGRYGIAGGREVEPGVLRLTTLVEKPDPNDAPSDLAVAARYALSPAVFGLLRGTPRGAGGEIQLTDALRSLMEVEPVHGVVLDARRHDIGNPVDWLKTNLTFAASDAELWREIAPLCRELLGG